jgi:hypothetical protein
MWIRLADRLLILCAPPLLLLLLSGRLAAQPAESNVQQTLARALGIAVTQIVDARSFSLQSSPEASGVVLGRYRESGTAWTFPVVGVHHPCPAGTCLSVLRLGQATNAMAPLALVDLEQPLAPVGSIDPLWMSQKVREPAQKARWPLLIIASEHQLQPPKEDKPQRTHGREERIEQTLYFVSLRSGKAPKLLHEHRLLEKSPESDDDASRGSPGRVGQRLEGLRIGRQGPDLIMSVIERDIDSRFSRCLRPEPLERRYRLVEDRFQESPNKAAQKAPRGGCR